MQALEQTPDKSATVANLPVTKQPTENHGQELPLEGRQSRFVEFLNYLKNKSVDASEPKTENAQVNAGMPANKGRDQNIATEQAKVDLNEAQLPIKPDNTAEVDVMRSIRGVVAGESQGGQRAVAENNLDAESLTADIRLEANQTDVGEEFVADNRKTQVKVQQGIENATIKQVEQQAVAKEPFSAEEPKNDRAEKSPNIESDVEVDTKPVPTQETTSELRSVQTATVLPEPLAQQEDVRGAENPVTDKDVANAPAQNFAAVEQAEEVAQMTDAQAASATVTAQANTQTQATASTGVQSATTPAAPQAAQPSASQANVNAGAAGNTSANAENLAGQSGQSGQSSQNPGQNAGQAQGQAAGQNANQNLGQTVTQTAQVLNANSVEKRRDIELGMRQQAQTRAADEALQKSNNLSNGSLDGVSGERRAGLPPSMQSIPLPVRHPQWGQALGQRVNYMINSQVQQAHITLNPEKLGPIQIKLHFDRDQRVQVSVLAQHGITRDAIDASIPRLREMLEQQGVNLASVDVETGESFAEQQTQQDDDNKSTAMGATDGNGGSVVDEEQSETKVASDSLVDYYA